MSRTYAFIGMFVYAVCVCCVCAASRQCIIRFYYVVVVARSWVLPPVSISCRTLVATARHKQSPGQHTKHTSTIEVAKHTRATPKCMKTAVGNAMHINTICMHCLLSHRGFFKFAHRIFVAAERFNARTTQHYIQTIDRKKRWKKKQKRHTQQNMSSRSTRPLLDS